MFYKNTEKKFKRKKNNNKHLRSIKDRKVNTNFCYGERNSFFTWQIQCRCYGGQGGLALQLGLLKIRFSEHHVRSRKPTMLQQRTITFNPTYLIKVTHNSSVTNNNFECLRQNYLLYFNVYMTDLLLLQPFLILNIRDDSFLVYSTIFCSYWLFGLFTCINCYI